MTDVDKTRTEGAETARRALRLLEALATGPDQRTADELADRVGLTRSTTYRLLRVLQEELYIDRVDGSYTLGSRLVGLAAAALPELDLYASVRPVLRRLVLESGETVTLHRRVGDLAVLVLGAENTEESLRRVARVGEAGPLFRGASGLAILASLSAEEVAGVVARAAAEPDRHAVLSQVARARELGCAISHGANHPGVNGIAAVVRSTSATAHATSIAVSGPASRWNDSRMLAFAEPLTRACDELSALFRSAMAGSRVGMPS